MTWADVEMQLRELGPELSVRLALRAARRVLPAITQDADHYGPVVIEWANSLDRVLGVAESGASAFRLLTAASEARCVAESLAIESRPRGPGPNREAGEMAAAAAALALDAARTPHRAAMFAMQSIRAACFGAEPTPELRHDLANAGTGEPCG